MKKQFLQMLFAMCFFLVLSVNKVYAGDYNLVDNQLIENYYDFVDEENSDGVIYHKFILSRE